MKKILWMFLWAGIGLTAAYGQTKPSATVQTNTPPASPPPTFIVHAPPQKRPLLGTNVQAGGFFVKAAKGKALQAINPFAPVPSSGKYIDESLDPRHGGHHGLALFWISF